jgi:hypothetical protein
MCSGTEIQEEEKDVLIKHTKDSVMKAIQVFIEQNQQMMIVHYQTISLLDTMTLLIRNEYASEPLCNDDTK